MRNIFCSEKKEAGADCPAAGGDQAGDGREEEGGGAEEEREKEECQSPHHQRRAGSPGEIQLPPHPHNAREGRGGRPGGGGWRDPACQSRGGRGGQPGQHEAEPGEEEAVAPVPGGQAGRGVERAGRALSGERREILYL